MQKSNKLYPSIIAEYRRHYLSGLQYYNKFNLGNRFRHKPNFEKHNYAEAEPFNDFLRQQIVDTHFRKRWLWRINTTAEKLRSINSLDYEKTKQLFNSKHFRTREY